MQDTYLPLKTIDTKQLNQKQTCPTSHFPLFNCCLSVVLQLEKGADPEKSHVVFCHKINGVLFNLLCVWILFKGESNRRCQLSWPDNTQKMHTFFSPSACFIWLFYHYSQQKAFSGCACALNLSRLIMAQSVALAQPFWFILYQ